MKPSRFRPFGAIQGTPPTWLWALIIFVLALVPRAFPLARYVTPDEPNWVYRTLNFSAALARGDWASTAQAGHPGVTTMWLGSLGLAVQRALDPARAGDALDWLARLDRLSTENIEALKRIGAVLDGARLPVIVVNALGVAGMFLLARRLFGQRAARLAAFLLALDPFVAGLGGLLHVDGLLATFSALCILALLNGVLRTIVSEAKRSGIAYYSPRSEAEWDCVSPLDRAAIPWFAFSGAMAGFALLSKSPALFLIPFAILVVVVAVVTRRIVMRQALLGLLVFSILNLSIFAAFYPAMWSSPSAALDLMFERAAHHATTATRPTFFDGQAELNLGPGFYPLALAYRLSPVVVAGLLLAVLFLVAPVRRQRAHSVAPQTLTLTLTLTFSAAFIVFLFPAAKKFDRYLLPAIPPVILVAAWGISQFTNRRDDSPAPEACPAKSPTNGSGERSRRAQRSGVSHPANILVRLLPAGAILLQALFGASVAPYLLMAYNPLLGGAASARDRIAIGWGEGFGAAVAWVAARDPAATIASGGLSNTVPVYAGRTVTIDSAGLASADYILFTLSEVQLFPEFFGGLARQGALAQTIHIGGVEAAWVYATTRPALQADWIRRKAQPGDAILLDAPTPLARLLEPLPVTVLPPDATPDLVSATLDALRERPRILRVSTGAASPVVRGDVHDWLEMNAHRLDETPVAGAVIGIYAPGAHAVVPNAAMWRLDSFVVEFDGVLALIGLEPLTESAAYPDPIAVAVRWRAIGRPTSNYSVTLELTDAYGDGWTKFGGPLRNAGDLAPIDWQPGEVVEQIFSTQTPPTLAPGMYRLRFSIDYPDEQRAGLVSASGVFSGTAPLLASLRIAPGRERVDPGALSVGQRVEHRWADRVELIGIQPLAYVVVKGDQFLNLLHWRSLREGLDPATEVRWTLTPQFATEMPPVEWRTALAPNMQLPLRQGDIVAVRYSERLPLELPDGRYYMGLAVGGEAIDVIKNIDIIHRDRVFELPAGAAAAGSIGAFAVYLAEPLPERVHPGDPIQVKLTLQASEEVLVNYTVFVHLVDPAGRIVAQVDGWPQNGGWPTANWVRGQVVEESYTLTPPPEAIPGNYRIVAGMYDALDGSRLTTRDRRGHPAPDGRLILGAPVQVVAP